MSEAVPILAMRGIEKSFYGVRVLNQVSLEARGGEVLALLGHNGAGKSTLIKILNGDYSRDGGEILIDGVPVELRSPRDAEAHGIQMIYQELHYAPDMTVAENVLLNHVPHRPGPLGRWLIDWPATYSRAAEILGLLQVDIDPRAPMRELGAAQKQIVQIAKALSFDARILVMDEPTAALTPHEVDLLFTTVETLRRRGVAIIYISHRLDEVFRIAQRVNVLRDGKNVGDLPIGEVTPRSLVRLMVGRDVAERHETPPPTGGPVALSARGLSREGLFADIDLDLHRGEIVGIFGLLGAGHIELSRALFGAERADRGSVEVDGKRVVLRDPTHAREVGIGFVPAERKVEGLVTSMSVRGNITLANWGDIARLGFLQEPEERRRARAWVERLGVRMSGSIDQEVRFLSGGNQQKVVLARWLEANTRILVLNEPTWGVDIGARGEIYTLLQQLKGEGFAMLIVSSDMEEVINVCDRVLVMRRGRIVAEVPRAEATPARLLGAVAGEIDEPEPHHA